jgi:DNA repair photolyase
MPMTRRTEFVTYRPKTILNKHKRPDHWFWVRYTAYPYKGCIHGCEFWYCLACMQASVDQSPLVSGQAGDAA